MHEDRDCGGPVSVKTESSWLLWVCKPVEDSWAITIMSICGAAQKSELKVCTGLGTLVKNPKPKVAFRNERNLSIF